MSNSELKHYGVKGMKWHHHKYKTPDNRPRARKKYKEKLSTFYQSSKYQEAKKRIYEIRNRKKKNR